MSPEMCKMFYLNLALFSMTSGSVKDKTGGGGGSQSRIPDKSLNTALISDMHYM